MTFYVSVETPYKSLFSKRDGRIMRNRKARRMEQNFKSGRSRFAFDIARNKGRQHFKNFAHFKQQRSPTTCRREILAFFGDARRNRKRQIK